MGWEEFRKVERELNDTYLERRDVVRGLMTGLIARQHVLLLGPPGTAKSALVEDLCSRVGGAYFRWLLTRTTVPEEIFGPLDIPRLKDGIYRRVTTGKLPACNVAFLDEIWKANSAVLNGLLTALNERLHFNDGAPEPIPLDFAVGASNELPEDRQELAALWDRFLLRYQVDYVQDPATFERLLRGGEPPGTRTTIGRDAVAQAQREAAQVGLKRVIPAILELRQKIASMQITVSDRRWKQALTVVQAHAWLEGRSEATDEDLQILGYCLWQEPGQIREVRQAIMAIANPLDAKAQDMCDEALEVYREAMRAANPDPKTAGTTGEDPAVRKAKVGMECTAKLAKLAQSVEKLIGEARASGKSDARLVEALEKITGYNQEVISKCMGLNLAILRAKS